MPRKEKTSGFSLDIFKLLDIASTVICTHPEQTKRETPLCGFRG